MTITQADRDAMVKEFERCNQCRLRPKSLADGWMHHDVVIYGENYDRLIEMIRGAHNEGVKVATVTIGDPNAHA